MNRFLFALIALVSVGSWLPDTADAARLGGGRSLGAQRQAVPQRQAAPPAQQQAAPAGAQSQPGRWLAPLAGLAAGLGLGWLFAQGGAGALLATLALALGAGFVLMLLVRLLARPRDQRAPMQYAGPGGEAARPAPPAQPAQWGNRGEAAATIPSGFDTDGFLRQAKRNFITLQDANDRGDVRALREVTTPEMFEALAAELAANARAGHQTDVIGLDAALLEVVTEGPLHWASVRFSGTIREDPRELPAAFEEIWHLQKPVAGSSGWVLAGIQQTA